jgi:hypothetical protein
MESRDEMTKWPSKSQESLGNRFTRLHGFCAAGLLIAFMGLVLFCCLMNWRAIGHNLPLVIRATLGTVTGPFDGPIARPCPGAAWMATWWCLPVCGSALVLAFVCQFVPLPFRRGAYAFRILTWFFGWFVWLCGAIPSLLNAID